MVRSTNSLKLNKSAGINGLEAEHLRYGGSALSIHLSIAFSGFLRPSLVPSQWLQSSIVPVTQGEVSTKMNVTCMSRSYKDKSISISYFVIFTFVKRERAMFL